MDDIRMENWYWTRVKEDDIQNAERTTEIKKHRRYARFLKWARRILLVELAVIGFEGLFRFGSLIRGYDSIGGEGILLIALAGVSVWYLRQLIK